LTVGDDLTIRTARIDVEPAARERAWAACRVLAGQRIDAASADETKARFARAAGCAHLDELLAAAISTARETIPTRQPVASRRDPDD
jgi:hypothetical protein